MDQMKEEHYTQVRDLKSKIFQLERERDEANIRVKEIEVKWQDEKADKQSLLYNIHLLRKRLQLLTAREIENQRQLRTFTKLQPLFKTLQEKFYFSDQVLIQLKSAIYLLLEKIKFISDESGEDGEIITIVLIILKRVVVTVVLKIPVAVGRAHLP